MRQVAVIGVIAWVACAAEPTRPTTRSATPPVPPAAPGSETRTRGELQTQLDRYLALIQSQRDDQMPRRGQPGFVQPPREPEVTWLSDRAAAVNERVEAGMKMFFATKGIMKRYMAPDVARATADPSKGVDSGESILWSVATTRLFGRVAPILVDEVLASIAPTDPTYATRLAGFGKMGSGAVEMLQGTLITLNARRAPVADRRLMSGVWRAYLGAYAKLWQPKQCAQLALWVREVLQGEDDATIRADLEAIVTPLVRCTGV